MVAATNKLTTTSNASNPLAVERSKHALGIALRIASNVGTAGVCAAARSIEADCIAACTPSLLGGQGSRCLGITELLHAVFFNVADSA